MKREFGKKLIEEFFPRVDLTHVIDTSGAYIPGHGTPTVILFARNRTPVARRPDGDGHSRRASTPDDPAGAWSGRRSWHRSTSRAPERVRQRRRLAAGVVSQASLVDRRRRGSRVEGAIGGSRDDPLAAPNGSAFSEYASRAKMSVFAIPSRRMRHAIRSQIHRRHW